MQYTPEEATRIVTIIKQQIGHGVLMSLGAHKLGHYTTAEGLHCLAFSARVLPFNAAGKRLETPRIMRVIVTLTARDDYEIAVDYSRKGQVIRHFHQSRVYADQLSHVLLDVDSDSELVDASIGHENRGT